MKTIRPCDLAVIAGTTQQNIGRLLKTRLFPALEGSRIDPLHPEVLSYLREREYKKADINVVGKFMDGFKYTEQEIEEINAHKIPKDTSRRPLQLCSESITSKQKEYFNSKIRRGFCSEECWEWTGAMRQDGYGMFRMGDHTYFPHRIAYILANGSIPVGLIVCHKCDNKRCVNPDHLWVGTNADNSRDMVLKGRQRTPLRGEVERHYMTQSKLEKAVTLRNDGFSLSYISDIIDIKPRAISRALKGQTYRRNPPKY